MNKTLSSLSLILASFILAWLAFLVLPGIFDVWRLQSNDVLFRLRYQLMGTRPIYHKCDETILGHVFCSFLAFVLIKELQSRLETRGHKLEWRDVIRDLDRLQEIEIKQDQKRFVLRTEATGTCGKVFQATGVAMPPTVRQVA